MDSTEDESRDPNSDDLIIDDKSQLFLQHTSENELFSYPGKDGNDDKISQEDPRVYPSLRSAA
jgi:hypothetical protein